MTEYTAKGKLYARLIHSGKREYPDEIPADLVQETYDAYTYYYQYTPELVPPNADSTEDEPVTEQPATEEPTSEEPTTTDEPATENTSADNTETEPTTEEPTSEEPTTNGDETA